MNRKGKRKPIVELDHVWKSYQSDGKRNGGVCDVSLRAHPGELILLLGPSGSGKTTLLQLISGLIRPTGGVVRLFGRRVEDYATEDLQTLRAQRIGFVFQAFHLLDALTVAENLGIVLSFAGVHGRDVVRRVHELLVEVRIDYLESCFPATLSQGEKQRVAVARAFANRPELLLADEPTASVDSAQGLEIVHLLRDYAKREDRCVIVASHDVRLEQCADMVIRLEDGRIGNVSSVPSDPALSLTS